MGDVILDERVEEGVVGACSFVISKGEGFVDVCLLLFFCNVIDGPVGALF